MLRKYMIFTEQSDNLRPTIKSWNGVLLQGTLSQLAMFDANLKDSICFANLYFEWLDYSLACKNLRDRLRLRLCYLDFVALIDWTVNVHTFYLHVCHLTRIDSKWIYNPDFSQSWCCLLSWYLFFMPWYHTGSHAIGKVFQLCSALFSAR